MAQPKLTMDIMMVPEGSIISGLDELLELEKLCPQLMIEIILGFEGYRGLGCRSRCDSRTAIIRPGNRSAHIS